jgi:RHS repeat-associated protein
MGESFSAQLSTGLATYSVPIGLPKARGNVQPSLVLSYSSSGGAGIAGVGWNVGVGAITRKTDHGMPTYDDRSEWHPNQDRFTFGGSELVPICLVTDKGCSGALKDEVMPSWAKGWQYFRPEVESGFLRFFWSPDHRTWRVQSKDGSALEFGVPLDGSGYLGALETNPSRSSEIIRWHVARQYDPHGVVEQGGVVSPVNLAVYRYQTDGNVVYLTDIFDTTPVTNPRSTDLGQYAHHTKLIYEERSDKLVSFRSGWRMDHRLRLSRVDVTVKPFASSSAARQLLRRYHLGYDGSRHASLLVSFQQEGRCSVPVEEGASGNLRETSCERLPTLRFDYQSVDSALSPVTDSAGLAFEPFATAVTPLPNSPPHSLGQMETGLMDVNGDSLPDVLVSSAALYEGAHGLFLNGASGALGFEAPRTMEVVGGGSVDAGILKLTNKHVSVLDLDSDGRINLVHMPNFKSYSVFSPQLLGSEWAWVGKSVSAPAGQDVKIDWTKNAEHTAVMDVNGDGLVDIVYASATEIQTFFSLGRYPGGQRQFGHATWTSATAASLSTDPIRTCVPWSATPVRFGDRDVHTADMNGDGLVDIVRVRNGQILYWPGRGNGTWGTGERDDCAAGTFGQDRAITMANAPYLNSTETSVFQISDVNADGLADVLKVRVNAVDVYLNDNGVGFSSRGLIANTPMRRNGSSGVALADIDGSGSADLVWGDARNYQYIDLTGGVQPYVLKRVRNGLGATTELDYSTSTQLMLKAKASGKPWTSVIPNVLPVVIRSTVRDNLEKIGRPGGAIVTEYEYRNPVFDGKARDFLGFREAQVRSVGDTNSPTSIARSEFLLGHWTDDASLSSEPEEKEDWRAALKGFPVVEEESDEGGIFRFTRHLGVTVQSLYTGLDGRRVFYRPVSTVTTFAYDTGNFVSSDATVTMDAYQVTIGSQTIKGTVKVPQRAGARTATLSSSTTQNAFGNVVQSQKNGCTSGCPNGVDQPIYVVSQFEIPEGDSSGWLWREVESYVMSTDGVPRHRRGSDFNAFGDMTKSYAWLIGSQALERAPGGAPLPSSASLGDTEEVLVTLGTTDYDQFGNPTMSRGPLGSCHSIKADDVYAEFVVEDHSYAGEASIDGCGRRDYVTIVGYDRGFGIPTFIKGPQGQPSSVEYDGFGRVIASYGPDEADPTALDPRARAIFQYVPSADADAQPYSLARKQSFHDGGASTSYVEDVTYFDGLGRTIFTLSEVDPEKGDEKKYIAAGGARYNAKGVPYLSYEAFFTDGPAVGFALNTQPTTATKSQTYDAFGRVVDVYLQDAKRKSHAVYHALSGDSYDAGDMAEGTEYFDTYSTQISDGHGRTVASISRYRSGTTIEEHWTKTTYLPSGEVATISQERAGSPSYRRTFEYDSWGRMVRNVEPNTTGVKSWRYAYDDASRLVATSDPNGCGVNYHYDTGGRLLGSDYSPCKANQEPYSAPNLTTGEGLETFYRYDSPDPLATNVVDAAGQSLAIDEDWLFGRLASVRTRGGLSVFAYDGLGRTRGTARRVARPNATGATAADRYAPRWYVKQFSFDLNGRPTRATTGAPLLSLLGNDGTSELQMSYTKRGLVASIGSSYGTLIGSAVRDARGLLSDVTLGDLAQTKRSFDYNELQQLTDVTTYRGPPSLWSTATGPYTPPSQTAPPTTQLTLEHYAFLYDDMGNLVRADDFRNAAEWTNDSRPVRREWVYDSYSRLTKTTYTYAAESNWKSPFAAENADPTRPQPAPQVTFTSRIKEETFAYDWLNNLISNTDDSNGFYDRSIGMTSFANAAKPHRMTGASNRSSSSTRQGELAVAYDDAGQVTAMVVQRDGPCVPSGSACWARYAYEWDEVGNLVRARRWDLSASERSSFGTPASVNGTTINHPLRDPEVEMRYQYDGGQRVVKTVVRGDTYAVTEGQDEPKYTVFALSTVELRGARWLGEGATADYELTSDTTELRLPAGSVMGRLVSNGVMPKTGQSQQHLLLTFSDQLGSTTFTIDHATSELVEYTTYTSFGQTESDYRTDRWDNHREHSRFTGKEEDIEVGLNYHGARYYSPALKRWMSADPVTIHSAGSDINPWAYGYGNPTSYVDPDGRLPVPVVTAIVGAVVSATVYCVTNGVHVTSKHWWAGLGIAAGSGAVAGLSGWAAGVGMGAAIGTGAAATFGGMTAVGAASGAGGAAGGYLASWGLTAAAARAGGNFNSSGYSWSGLGKATLTGLVSGGISGGGTNLGGAYIGTAAGTSAGIAFGSAAWGEDPTWKSAGLAFSSAFMGMVMSSALSSKQSEAAQRNAKGFASRDEAAAAGMREYEPKVAAMTADHDPHEIGFLIYELEGKYRYSDPVIGAAKDALTLAEFKSISLPSGARVTDMAHVHPMLNHNVDNSPFAFPLTDGSSVVSPMSIDDELAMSREIWRETFGLTDDSRSYVGTPDGRLAIYSVSGNGVSQSLPRLAMPGMEMPYQRTQVKAGDHSMKAVYARFR